MKVTDEMVKLITSNAVRIDDVQYPIIVLELDGTPASGQFYANTGGVACRKYKVNGEFKPFILVFKELIDQFVAVNDNAGLTALLLHEEGHITHGHIDSDDDGKDQPVTVINNVDMELEADAYAASKIGATAVKRGIIRGLNTLCAMIEAGSDAETARVISESYQPVWKKRRAALVALGAE